MTDQIPTNLISAEAVMGHKSFRLGVEDARAGRRPRFDDLYEPCWAYERGRLFACLAPRTMPIFIGGKLNPKAVTLFRAAYWQDFIR